MARGLRTRRYDDNTLQLIARAKANEAQKVTLETLYKNGFKCVKLISNDLGSAINMAAGKVSGWVTLDGKFHRPLKGKAHVSINTRTLERVW